MKKLIEEIALIARTTFLVALQIAIFFILLAFGLFGFKLLDIVARMLF